MLNVHRLLRALSLLLLLSIPAVSWAQIGSNPETIKGFYLGGGMGVSTLSSQDDDDWWDTDTETGDPDFSYALTGGYRFSRYFGMEVAYFDGSDLDWDDSPIFIPALADTYRVDADVDLSSLQVSALAVLPFANVAELYVRGGLSFWDADSDLRYTAVPGGAVTTSQNSDDGVSFVIGIGGGVSVTENLHLRLDYNTYELDEDVLGLGGTDYDAYASSLTFQALYRFGKAWPASR